MGCRVPGGPAVMASTGHCGGQILLVQNAAGAEDAPLDHVLQGDGAEEQVNLVAQLLPEVVGEAPALVAGAALGRARRTRHIRLQDRR